MRIVRQLAVTAFMFGVLVVEAPPAAAPPTQNCDVVDFELVCDWEVEEPGGGGAPVGTGGTGGGGEAPTAVWNREIIVQFIGPGATDWGCTTDDDEPGSLYRDTLRDVATGEVLNEVITCVPDDDPSPEPPPQPPAPPTREEVLDAAAIPELEIAADPSGRGLTGLESRFWVVDPGEVTATTDPLRGWTVSGSLAATNWVWETGDGDDYQTPTSGSVDEPAVRHTYEHLPDQESDAELTFWPVEVAVTWEGEWTISGYGTEFVIDDLTTTTVAGLDYEIISAVSRLDEVEESN